MPISLLSRSSTRRVEDQNWRDILTALSNPYRRQLLVALLDHNPQDDEDLDPLDVVGDSQQEIEVLESELVHVHLPKLESMGIVAWDRETGEISTGAKWPEYAPLLKLIHDHRDELPDGWL